jgi:hypothetical protein
MRSRFNAKLRALAAAAVRDAKANYQFKQSWR